MKEKNVSDFTPDEKLNALTDLISGCVARVVDKRYTWQKGLEQARLYTSIIADLMDAYPHLKKHYEIPSDHSPMLNVNPNRFATEEPVTRQPHMMEVVNNFENEKTLNK